MNTINHKESLEQLHVHTLNFYTKMLNKIKHHYMHVHTFLQSANCIILENVARSFAIVFERKKFLVLLVLGGNKSLGFLDKHSLHSLVY